MNLVSFGYNCENSAVKLNWTTASEINNSFFKLEKSANGIEFAGLAEVKGAGNSNSPLKYNYTDWSPANGVSYYRLSQTDFDGSTEQLNTISVRCADDSKSVVTAYNNNEGNIVILSDMITHDNFTVRLYDALGKNIRSASYESDKGVSTHFLDIKGLNAGIYLISIEGKVEKVSKKIVVN